MTTISTPLPTVAEDLPFTADGLLDLPAMARDANGDFKGRPHQINSLHRAINGSAAVVSILQLENSLQAHMDDYMRGGLLNALSYMLEGMAAEVASLEQGGCAR